MSSKPSKGEKSFQEKFKQWFKVSKAVQALPIKDEELILTPDIQLDIGSESDVPKRVNVIASLTPAVECQRLQDHGVELLLMKTRDLVSNPDPEVRKCILTFYGAVVRGQFDTLDVMRAEFFRLIETHPELKDDFGGMFDILFALTKEGKTIDRFADKIGPFLFQKGFPIVLDSGKEKLLDFLHLTRNIIRWNPNALETDAICATIGFLGRICVDRSSSSDVIQLCLESFYDIMGFSYIPREALPSFIATLCRVVNMEDHCEMAWKTMHALMSTHLGHSALYNLCQFIQSKEGHSDAALVRGAVFYIGMSLWGSRCVKTMQSYSTMTILPSFVEALHCNHYLVTYEVALQLERLVVKKGDTLRAPGCDCALDLIEALMESIAEHCPADHQAEVFGHLHNTISTFESLSAGKTYRGSQQKLFHLIDKCSRYRPDESVLRLLEYRAKDLYPTKSGWIYGLHSLMDKYYRSDDRDAVRIKCLNIMTETVLANRHMYEPDLMEKVVVPFMKSLDGESSVNVRVRGVWALTELLCECSSGRCMALLDVLERVVTKPLEQNSASPRQESELSDVHAAISGLIRVFKVKLCQQPAAFIVKIFGTLCQHLEDNYRHQSAFANAGHVRREIFQLLMALRVSESYHLGVCDADDNEDGNSDVRFSPFIIDSGDVPAAGGSSGVGDLQERHKSASQPLVYYVTLRRACRLVVKSLSEETDWNVLKLVLAKVPTVLQNRAIITRYGNAIKAFALPLVDLTSRESKLPDGLKNKPSSLTRSEFHNRVFPVLAAMASFNEYLESAVQRELINALHTGLLSKECNKICISALTACALEMKRSMYHVIPQVLLNFSKISATKMIASPMLEFLSTLIRLPDIFSSFTDTNYMSVFAIALPFTNPFKFDAYIVSMAHHILIMWFLKCRLSYRQNFVQFIVTGLNANLRHAPSTFAIAKQVATATTDASSSSFRQRSTTGAVQPSQGAGAAGKSRAATAAAALRNMDSADRKRSSSLSDGSSVKSGNAGGAAKRSSANSAEVSEEQKRVQKVIAFHEELTETCVDILARYMFANAAVHPKRLPTTDFLLKEGNSATWLLNTMLITVTTSLCDQSANRGGLCDRCHLICSKNSRPVSDSGMMATNPADPEDPNGVRVRHQSEFHAQKPSPSRYVPGSSARDDYDLRRQLSVEKLSAAPTPEAGGSLTEMGQLEALMKEQKEKGTETKKPDLCSCWCSGWAEIHIRRPSGDVSWMCRIQNSSLVSDSHGEFPLADLTALFQPTKDNELHMSMLDTSKRIPIESLTEKDYDALTSDTGEQSFSIAHHLKSDSQEAPEREVPQEDSAGVEDSGSVGSGAGSKRESASYNPTMEKVVEEELDATAAVLRRKERVQEILRRRQSLQTIGVEEALLRRQVSSSSSSSSPKARQSPLSRSRQESGTRTPPASAAVGERPVSSMRNQDSSANSRRSSGAVVGGGGGGGGPRDRAHTISGPSPLRTSSSHSRGEQAAAAVVVKRGPDFLKSGSSQSQQGPTATSVPPLPPLPPPKSEKPSSAERVTGISPQFVFLQLYHLSCFANVKSNDAEEKPVMLPASRGIEMSIKNLDRIHAHETHKIGVIYIGPGQQDDETAILTNAFGSLRYTQFLHGLGSLLSLKDIDKQETFTGGLDHKDGDGDFAYVWEDDVMQVTFHVATLMPSHEKDPKANKKKRHIGNDFVAIVYNNSGGRRYKLGTVKGQFIYACVIIVPLDHGSNRVFIDCKPELDEPLGHVKEPKIVSDRNLAVVVRQLALHCNLAAQIKKSLGSGRDPYSSNWLERLRQIKRIRAKVAPGGSEAGPADGRNGSPPSKNDFTRMVSRKTGATD